MALGRGGAEVLDGNPTQCHCAKQNPTYRSATLLNTEPNLSQCHCAKQNPTYRSATVPNTKPILSQCHFAKYKTHMD